jgi:integrase
VPVIGNMAMDEITVQDILQVLEPIWHTKTTTADRVRDRIRTIFDWATVKGHFDGRNPAAWQGNLKFMLPSPSKIHKVEHKPALSITDAPTWFSQLRERHELRARALEFLALTAVRNGEVLGATWDEIQDDMWIILADRMKMKKEHRVPLTVAAQALLDDLPRTEGTNLIFPSRVRSVMGDTRTSDLMKDISEAHGPFNDPQTGKRAVPQGLRSTFHNTCTEAGWDHNLIEMALAHDIGTAVTRAYMRTDMVEKRRQLMEFWSDHLHGTKADDNVVELHG